MTEARKWSALENIPEEMKALPQWVCYKAIPKAGHWGERIEDLILLTKRLGHRAVQETLNTYSHLFPNAQRKILESIDEGAEM